MSENSGFLLKYLPDFLGNYLSKRANLLKIVSNIGWLTFEKFFRLGLGLVVGVAVARYLGPSQYGILQYATSLMSFMGAFVYLGLSGLVIRDLVKEPEKQGLLLGTTFGMKFLGSIAGYIAILAIAFTAHADSIELRVLAIIGLTLFLKPFQVIDFWFQSKTMSKYSVGARSLSFFILVITKLLLVYFAADLVTFAVAVTLELVLAVIFLLRAFFKQGQSIKGWSFTFQKAKSLLSQSWIIIISGFLATVYLKIDQLMLRWLIGTEEVGIYSVAVTFSEVWYFIPNIVCVSIYPTLIKQKQNAPKAYQQNLQRTLDTLFGIALIVASAMTLVGPFAINLLYGEPYQKAGLILTIHIWAGLFIFMRALFSKWVFIEDLLIFSLATHGLGAIINLVANYLLIPDFGGQGAAIATLASYAVSSYFALFLSQKTRPMAKMMTKSILLPIRLVYSRLTPNRGAKNG